MGATATPISLDEYLSTSYKPDMEFVDGALVRRNGGTQKHGHLQLVAGSYFREFRRSHQIKTFVETRLLVDRSTGRCRMSDRLPIFVFE